MPAEPGQLLSHYRLVEKIGEGGMGVVYRARDEHLERDVAVKVLRPGAVADESARNRFRKEALALSKLNHPNIATIYDFDTQDGVDFLAMEYVRGKTLNERLAGGPLSERETLGLGRQLAEGLIAAHAEGILHRDLKPGNLRISHDDRLKILDFGLAKVLRALSETAPTETQTRGVVGTLAYMAPEQLRGAEVDERTDLYAAGAVLYEMASGKRAFPETDPAHLVHAVLNKAPVPLPEHSVEVSHGLTNVVGQSMAKLPAERYASAVELRDDLERLEQGFAPTAEPPRGKRWRRSSVIAAIVAVLAMVAFAVGIWWQRGSETEPGQVPSIAVLPLENLSGDSEEDYFSDGMTVALITQLGKIGALRTIAWPSVKRFKSSEQPLHEIAALLEVESLVVGSVQRSGERVAIMAQMYQFPGEQQKMSERYERDLRDVLTLQGEIANAIAAEVNAVLTPEQAELLTRSRAVSPLAHEAYLQGRYFQTELDFDKALEHYLQAVEEDPDFALAWAGLAGCYNQMEDWGLLPTEDALAKAKQAATRALEIDGALPAAHSHLANALKKEWDWAGAEVEFERALQLGPGEASGHHLYALYLSEMGQHDEAVTEMRRACDLDPLSLIRRTALGVVLNVARRHDEAIEQLQETLELDPDFRPAHYHLFNAYLFKGMYNEAVEAFGSDFPGQADEARQAFSQSGIDGFWRWRLARLEQNSKTRHVAPYFFAEAYAFLGETDRSLKWLERMYDQRDSQLITLREDPVWDPLRADPRFQDLVRRMDFPPK